MTTTKSIDVVEEKEGANFLPSPTIGSLVRNVVNGCGGNGQELDCNDNDDNDAPGQPFSVIRYWHRCRILERDRDRGRCRRR